MAPAALAICYGSEHAQHAQPAAAGASGRSEPRDDAAEDEDRQRRGDGCCTNGRVAAVLELLARKDQALLVRRDALLVLDLGLDVVNRSDGSTSSVMVLPARVFTKICMRHEAEAEGERRTSGCCIREGAAVLELLAREDQATAGPAGCPPCLDLGLDVVSRALRTTARTGAACSGRCLEDCSRSAARQGRSR